MSGEKSCRKPSRLSKSRSLGVFTLILALFIFQVTAFLWDKIFVKDAEPLSDGQSVQSMKEHSSNFVCKSAENGVLFEFDPNTITLDSLCMLGLTTRQAQAILNYRVKGGRFVSPEDFARMFVVSDDFYGRVRPYICIRSVENVAKTGDSVPVREKSVDLCTKTVKSEPKEMKPNSVKLIVELNGADSAALVRLYGIGPYYAVKIIEYRERLGGFHSVRQLMEIGGIDSARFEGFSKNVAVDPLKIKGFRLDTAGKSFLITHPYIGAYTARGIILLREKLGKSACTLENLVKEKILSADVAERLWPYVR